MVLIDSGGMNKILTQGGLHVGNYSFAYINPFITGEEKLLDHVHKLIDIVHLTESLIGW